MSHRVTIPPDRMVIEYDVDPKETMDIYNDAAGLRAQGWRMLSIDSYVRAYVHGWFRPASAPDTLRFTVLYEKVESPGP